jgi:hypothetical protein
MLNAGECDNWQTEHPEWIWCDDFEEEQDLNSQYEDVSLNNLTVSDVDPFYGIYSLQQHYDSDQVDAGWIIKLNNGGFDDHIFMRWYHKFEQGFEGFPPKMGRIRYRDRDNWNTIFAVHCWLENDGTVCLDVSAENSSQANSSGWLPIALSDFTFLEPENIGRWICFEMEVRVNTRGQTDGLYRLFIDDELKIERTEVDLRGDTDDKINELMLDCYWNGGSPKVQNRYYDNFVASTNKIGPYDPSNIKDNLNHAKANPSLTTFTPPNSTIGFTITPANNNDFTLTVYNAAGKKIWSYKHSEKKTSQCKIIMHRNLTRGIYLAVLEQEEGTITRKFTVMR